MAVALLLSTVLRPLSAEIPNPLRVSLIPDLFPVSFIGEEGEPGGAFPLVIAEIARRNNLRVEWVTGNWNENLERARRGEIDLMIGLIYTSDRSEFLSYGSEPVLSAWSQVFQGRSGGVETIFDIEGKRVGMVVGDQNAKGFVSLAESFGIRYEALYFDSFENIVNALETGDLDAGVFYSLYRFSSPGLVPTNIIFQPSNSYFAVPYGSDREILRLIDKTLLEWKADGDSFYYREVVDLLSLTQKTVPKWLIILIPVLGGSAVLAGFLAWILRAQVRSKSQELENTQEMYRDSFMEADVGIVHTGHDGHIRMANPMFCRYLGYEEKEFEKSTLSDLTHPEDREDEGRLLQDLAGGERSSYLMNKRFLAKDGSIVWGHVSVTCGRSETGEAQYYVCVVEDITAMKEAESRLGDLESRYLGLFQNSYQATALFDALGCLVDANDSLLKMMGSPANLQELIGLRPEDMDWLGPVGSLRIQEMIEECLNSGRIIRHAMSREETGSKRAMEVTIKPVTGADGSIRYCIAEGHDITELMDLTGNLEKQVEERTKEIRDTHRQLIESEKMASLGRLVAGVAHEINTPIGVARTGISYFKEQISDIRKQYEEGSLTRQDFLDALDSFGDLSAILERNFDRAARLLQDFEMTSADRSEREIRAVDPKEYLNAVMQTLGPKLREAGIEWTVEAPPDELLLNVGTISRILVNLTENALSHAYSDGDKGRLTIVYSSSGGRRRLEFSDDGKGIPAEHRDRIFEPFYTTERSNGFTGLGLSIVYSLTTEILNGTIACRSSEGNGTTFVIDYPEPGR